MNIYENVATEAMVLLFKTAAVWKKRLVFNFLLEPFEQNAPKKKIKFEDIADVESQKSLKGSRPDFTITLNNGEKIHFEVKINNADLTDSERKKETRNAFLVKDDYTYRDEIPKTAKVLTWDDLFNLIDENEATSDFAMFDLLRQTMFGNTVNKDYEFLSRFLYNEELIKKELQETLLDVLKLMKKDDSKIDIVPNSSDAKLGFSLKKGRSCLALEYQFGNEYHTGNFLFDGKEFSVEKDIRFEKKFDRVIYFCDKLYSFRKDYKEKFDTFLLDEKEFYQRVLKDYADALSLRCYWQLCQEVFEKQLYKKMNMIAQNNKLYFEADDLNNLDGYCPQFKFYKKEWGRKFFIAFELGIDENYKPTIKRNNYPEFYYGIWINPFDPPKCLEKLKKCIKNGYETTEWFPRRKNFDKNSPYKFFNPETILKINENPKELTDIIEPIVVELLDAISSKGL